MRSVWWGTGELWQCTHTSTSRDLPGSCAPADTLADLGRLGLFGLCECMMWGNLSYTPQKLAPQACV